MASSTAVPAPRRGPSALAVCGTGLAIAVAALLIGRATVGEILVFACYEAAFVLVPGLPHCSSHSRGRPRRVADTLAIAWPLGLAAEIGVFVLSAAVGARWLLTVFPAVVIALAAPLLWVRRADLGSPWPVLRRPVDRRVAIAVTSIVAGAACVVFLTLFAPSLLPRDIRSASYYPDLIFNVSLAAELLHHWPFMIPSLAGAAPTVISANVGMAAAVAQVTHIDLATVAMRLQPTVLIGVVGVQLFALGRKVGRSRTAGLFAAVLGLFAGELNFSWQVIAGGGAAALGGLYSPSYQLGAVFFFAILNSARGSAPQGASAMPRTLYSLTLGILALGAVGAKATVVPVLAGGLALFALGHALSRRGLTWRRLWTADICDLAVVVLAGVVGYALIYRGGGGVVVFRPGDFLTHTYTGFAQDYVHVGQSPLYLVTLAGAGAVVLASCCCRSAASSSSTRGGGPKAPRSRLERLLLCIVAASVPPFVLLAAPGDSEGYFITYGVLAGSVVSAAGLASACADATTQGEALSAPGLVCAAGTLAVIVGLWLHRGPGALLPAYALTGDHRGGDNLDAPEGAFAASAAERGPHPLALGVLVLIALTVVSEPFELIAPTIDRWIHGESAYEPSGINQHRGITADLLRGLVWLRDHSRVSDVIAVNNHEIGVYSLSRYYYYSAFAERRVFLESWDYTPAGYRRTAAGSERPAYLGRLALNNAAIDHASPTAIAELRDRYGVRYILIDRLHGPASRKPGPASRSGSTGTRTSPCTDSTPPALPGGEVSMPGGRCRRRFSWSLVVPAYQALLTITPLADSRRSRRVGTRPPSSAFPSACGRKRTARAAGLTRGRSARRLCLQRDVVGEHRSIADETQMGASQPIARGHAGPADWYPCAPNGSGTSVTRSQARPSTRLLELSTACAVSQAPSSVVCYHRAAHRPGCHDRPGNGSAEFRHELAERHAATRARGRPGDGALSSLS